MCFNYSKNLGKIRKIIHKIKTTFKKVLDQSTNAGLQIIKASQQSVLFVTFTKTNYMKYRTSLLEVFS